MHGSMFTKTHTRLASVIATLGLATMLLVPANAQTTNVNGNGNVNLNANSNGSVSTGAPIIEATFDIINTRTNTDATTTPAKPGDILRVSANIKNVGNGDLTLIPRVISEELFKLGQVIDPGNGGVPSEQRAMVFPQISLAAGCNCDEDIAFSVKLSPTMCTDYPALVTGNVLVQFQEKVKRIALECPTAAPITTTTVTPTPTPTKVTPPTTPKTGPEDVLAMSLVAAAAGAGIIASRRLLRRKK